LGPTHSAAKGDHMKEGASKLKITVFHCINTFGEGDLLPLGGEEDPAPKFVKLPCSSMVKDVFLLRAFEAGADGVVVLVCPEGRCRYVEGNLRAKKRVRRVEALLEEIGLEGRRLFLFEIASGDTAAAAAAIRAVADQVTGLASLPPLGSRVPEAVPFTARAPDGIWGPKGLSL